MIFYIVTSLVTLTVFTTVMGTNYYVPRTKRNWTEAVERCDCYRMQLAVVDTAEKHDAVAQAIYSSAVFSQWWTDVWIGASDILEEGVFRWKSTGETLNYTNWKAGQPNNYDGEEHCVHLQYISKVGFKWNDDQCSKKKYFICEKVCQSTQVVNNELGE
uniref:Putative secreted protein n=1 Tax=Aedes albopictus TaxID=7160 RepID=A0A023EFS7_AEDAL